MNNNLNLLKIITGLNKTVNIAKQVIPIYKQVKPMLSKSTEFINKLNKPQPKLINEPKEETETSPNTPVFFQ